MKIKQSKIGLRINKNPFIENIELENEISSGRDVVFGNTQKIVSDDFRSSSTNYSLLFTFKQRPHLFLNENLQIYLLKPKKQEIKFISFLVTIQLLKYSFNIHTKHKPKILSTIKESTSQIVTFVADISKVRFP